MATMKDLFTIDGVAYKVHVTELVRNFQVTDGPNAGRTLAGTMTRDVIGTFYNYSIKISRSDSSLEDYDALYDVISSPVDSHTIVVAYGQDMLTFEAYITNGSDTLIRKDDNGAYWSGLSFNFISMAPQRS